VAQVETRLAVAGDDRGIPLGIAAALADVRDRENLFIRVTGLPAGARLSAGIEGPAGTWSLAPADLDDLAIALPADQAATVTLLVTASLGDAGGGERAATAARLAVTVEPLPEGTAAAIDARPAEKEPIAVDIAAALADVRGRANLFIQVAGVPAGARLSAGSANRDGTWTLEPADIDDLSILLPATAGAAVLTVTALVPAADETGAWRILARLMVDIAADAESAHPRPSAAR
jgi:hypothetical protein